MADERVGETLEDGRGVGAALGVGQRNLRHDLVEEDAAQEGRDLRVLGHLLDGVEAGEVGGEHGGRVAAVQDAHLAGAVGPEIVGPDHVEAGLGERQLSGDRLRPLDHPDMEGLGGDRERVLVAPFAEQRLLLGGGEARDDTVDKRVEEHVAVLDPGDEGGLEAPAAGVTEDDAA